jgi:hypothetical protein
VLQDGLHRRFAPRNDAVKSRYASAVSRRDASELLHEPPPRGSRECRLRAAPAVSCAKMHKKKRTRAYRFSGNTPAFPAQWLYGLCRALVSAKSARMCERAALTNRPSLDLSPIALKGPLRDGMARVMNRFSRTAFARMHSAPTRRARANKPRFCLRRSFALSLRSDAEVPIYRLVNGKGAISLIFTKEIIMSVMVDDPAA